LLAVAVCGEVSLLIHLTFVPRLMVMWAGLKLKSLITTRLSAPPHTWFRN
jgi:hypothetical protein